MASLRSLAETAETAVFLETTLIQEMTLMDNIRLRGLPEEPRIPRIPRIRRQPGRAVGARQSHPRRRLRQVFPRRG